MRRVRPVIHRHPRQISRALAAALRRIERARLSAGPVLLLRAADPCSRGCYGTPPTGGVRPESPEGGDPTILRQLDPRHFGRIPLEDCGCALRHAPTHRGGRFGQQALGSNGRLAGTPIRGRARVLSAGGAALRPGGFFTGRRDGGAPRPRGSARRQGQRVTSSKDKPAAGLRYEAARRPPAEALPALVFGHHPTRPWIREHGGVLFGQCGPRCGKPKDGRSRGPAFAVLEGRLRDPRSRRIRRRGGYDAARVRARSPAAGPPARFADRLVMAPDAAARGGRRGRRTVLPLARWGARPKARL